MKSFNRTIVELKFLVVVEKVKMVFTFNRTIVELKFRFCWAPNRVAVAFNRTIVELKFNWHKEAKRELPRF